MSWKRDLAHLAGWASLFSLMLWTFLQNSAGMDSMVSSTEEQLQVLKEIYQLEVMQMADVDKSIFGPVVVTVTIDGKEEEIPVTAEVVRKPGEGDEALAARGAALLKENIKAAKALGDPAQGGT